MSDFAFITEGMAAELGLVIVEPRENVLQLDIDTGAQRDQYEIQRLVLQSIIPILETVATTSKGGKTHLYLCLRDSLSAEARIALQASLGSDPKREILTLRNLRDQRAYPLFLYEKPEEAAKVHHLSLAGEKEEAARRDQDYRAIFGHMEQTA